MDQRENARIDRLFRDVAALGLNRRQMIQRAAAMGIAPTALAVAFAQTSAKAVAQGADNPLSVDPAAPLDVVIFKGGWSDEYAINVNDTLYKKLYPDAEITYTGTQRLQEQYQARFVDNNPPDVMDNSGSGAFNVTTLVNEGQLADLTPLMDAPAYGQDGVTFRDSLLAGSQESGVYDGKQYVLNYIYTIWGIWYNQALFDEKGWTYPTTWDDMLAMCEEIKGAGIAPWTYAGQYPQYVRIPNETMIWKLGGWDAILKMDNLAEDAWTQEPVKVALNAWKQLVDKGYIMEGTEALNHTDSQAQWLSGKAAFLPNGSWLANEMKGKIPEGFQFAVKPAPSLTANDMMPQTANDGGAGELFLVPSKGKNVAGGMEWLRLLFSKEGAAFFSETCQAPTVVKGVGEGMDLGPTFASVNELITAAEGNIFSGTRYVTWYSTLEEEARFHYGELLTGRESVDDMCNAMQEAINAVREDDSIKKYTREPDAVPGEGTPAASPEATPAS